MVKKKSTVKRGRFTKRSASAASKREGTSPQNYKWTLMLYLAGDNNLSDEMVWAIKEIYRVGAPNQIAITMQFDPLSKDTTTRFYRTLKTQEGKQDGVPPTINIDGVFPFLHSIDLPEVDCGDPDVLAEFIVRSVKELPAENYLLILAGHGSGIVGDFLTDSDRKHELQPGSLTIPDLRQVFPRVRELLEEEPSFQRGDNGPVVDVLGMDSCLMSMAEICSEISGHVSYLVGSEGFDPNTGWPYFRLLERLAQLVNSDPPDPPDPAKLARLLVDRYTTYYADFLVGEISVDISACDVSKPRVEALEEAVKSFVTFCLGLEDDVSDWIFKLIILAHWKAQSYKWEQYTDLWDFCDLLSEESSSLAEITSEPLKAQLKELVDRCKAIQATIAGSENAMVRQSDFSGAEFQHSHGLSVYFPWNRRSFKDEYRSTAFAMRTGWDEFLEKYLRESRRQERSRVPELPPSARRRKTRAQGITVSIPAGEAIVVSRVSAPASRVSAPSSRDAASSTSGSPQSYRVSAPSSRVSAPSSRFAQQLDAVMNDLSSSMKNPPETSGDVFRFRKEDWPTIKRLPTLERIVEDLKDAGDAGKRLLDQLNRRR
jgi:hypothetical protein